MCEYCTAADINHTEAFTLLANYKRMSAESVVSIDKLHADFSAIYKNAEMAAMALRRLENRNKELGRVRHGFFAKDVILELEAIVGCCGSSKPLLDG